MVVLAKPNILRVPIEAGLTPQPMIDEESNSYWDASYPTSTSP